MNPDKFSYENPEISKNREKIKWLHEKIIDLRIKIGEYEDRMADLTTKNKFGLQQRIMYPEGENYRVVLLGSAGVGKTSFITRHQSGEFSNRYIATVGTEYYQPLICRFKDENSEKNINFQMIETKTIPPDYELEFNPFQNAHAVLIMIDMTSKHSYREAKSWYRNFLSKYPSLPILVLANKIDVEKRQVKMSVLLESFGLPSVIPISTKSCYNFDTPFLGLARILVGNDKLRFARPIDLVDNELLHPSDESIDQTPNKIARLI